MGPEVTLIVNGFGYRGWKSVRVTRSIESIAGSFALEVSDRWGGQDISWPIVEEDACRVEIGGATVIDGFVDKRDISLTATQRSLSYSGRDRAAVLVDCSAVVSGASEGSNKWTYLNVDVVEYARAIAEPFGIRVTVQPGLKLDRIPKLVVHPGDTGFEALKRAGEHAGVIVVSDTSGGVVIQRAGTGATTARATALVQGFNILSASVSYDGTDRFHRYLISSQVPGTDEDSGEATRVQAEAVDLGVARKNRVVLIRPDKGYNTADARRRADWEARVRAAKAETVTIGVQGWAQPGGELWPVNALALVAVPAIGIHGDLLISQVEYSMSDSGQVTQLRLVRPDAFLPEPKATVSGEGAWKELATGAF